MSVDNLATVIGVNLIRSKVEDPAVIMRGMAGPVVKAGTQEITITTFPLIFVHCSVVSQAFSAGYRSHLNHAIAL